MSRGSYGRRFVLSLVLQCWLFGWTAMVDCSVRAGNKIFWGWWKPTTAQPVYTTATSTAGSQTQADQGYQESPATEPTGSTANFTEAELESNSTTEIPTTLSTTDLSDTTGTQLPSTNTTELSDTTEAVSEAEKEEEEADPTFDKPPNDVMEGTTTEATPTFNTTSTPGAEGGSSGFAVYWNVPSFQCHKYGLNFSRVAEWGLRQNGGDEFRGQALAILYDPGEFPALLPAGGERKVARNGGVPQEGDLTRHLELFAQHLDKLIPDTQFSGLGVIDFEHWRPVWRQNWGSLAPYRDYSRVVERRRHPYWFSSFIEAQATSRYEYAARTFMLETLRMAKRIRPHARWGYYGYPLCFNYTPNNNRPTCSAETRRDNDGMSWMFDEVTSHFPSLYLKERDMHTWKRSRFVEGRLQESMRVAKDVPVYPYVWYKYHDTNKFLSQEDMVSVLRRPLSRGCRGVVVWGASRDVNTREKCLALAEYLERVLGPAVRELASEGWRDREEDIDLEQTTPAVADELGQDYGNVPFV